LFGAFFIPERLTLSVFSAKKEALHESCGQYFSLTERRKRNAMSIVLMTTNMRKIAEYRRFFARHAQTLQVEEPTEIPERLVSFLQSHKAVLADESNIFDLEGDLVAPNHVGPARNICRLHAWVLVDGKLTRMSYIREIEGNFDTTLLRPDNPEVFDWDSAFTPVAGVSLHDMAEAGLKNSAREQCLSAFTRAFLRRTELKTLKWTQVNPESIIDWSVNARLLLEHSLYDNLSAPLTSALNCVVNGGVFFRAAMSRRDGNYWFPGLNGGLPFVPKGDAVHEGTYMFHDVMHQLMPDLVYDGADTDDHRRVYIAYRMMSEAVSLTLADMKFVDRLSKDSRYASYDFASRHIHPLYNVMSQSLHRDTRTLLRRVAKFVLLGDASGFPTGTPEWAAFEKKYSRFFVADFQWTRMNWANLVARGEMSRRWIDLIRPATLRSQGIALVSDVVDELGRGLDNEALFDRLFTYVWRKRIMPALTYEKEADVPMSVSNGFRRWLTGQCAFFARYAPIIGIPPLGHELAERLRDVRPFDDAEMYGIRERFSAHVRAVAARGLISDDDAAIFPHLFPLFDPFFLRDYDKAQQEFQTVAEASAVALGRK
jgi:hypothetical protein